MPAQAQHLEQARANRAFAERLLELGPSDPTFRQWAVTAAFYCAVHCVEAYLARLGRHSQDHEHRRQLICRGGVAAVPPEVFRAYRQLQQWSEQARYLMGQFSEQDVRTLVLGQMLPRVAAFARL